MTELIDLVDNNKVYYYKLCYSFLYFGVFNSKYVLLIGLCLFLLNNFLLDFDWWFYDGLSF